VLRALEQNPELRFQQAGEMKSYVDTIVATPVMFEKSAPSPDRPAVPGRFYKILFGWLTKAFCCSTSTPVWSSGSCRRGGGVSTSGHCCCYPAPPLGLRRLCRFSFSISSKNYRREAVSWTIFPLSSEDRQWLMWMIISASDGWRPQSWVQCRGGTGHVPAARSLMAERVVAVFSLAMLLCGSCFIGSWKHDASKTVPGLINFDGT